MSFNPALHFDNPEYADIIITYSGRKTYCHKLILCTTSQYFEKMCGSASSFAESTQPSIDLKDDDPDAMYHFLRFLYTNNADVGKDRSANYLLHMEIVNVAEKYGCSVLELSALLKFHEIVEALQHPTEIFQAISQIRSSSDVKEEIFELAARLEARHFLALLDVDGFREQLGENQELMWKYLNEYTEFKKGLKEMKMVWCGDCGGGNVHDLDTTKSLEETPTDAAGMHEVRSLSCWIAKEAAEDDVKEFNLDGYSCLSCL